MKHDIPRTLESWAFKYGEIGTHFYTDKDDKSITALANYYNRKVSTERLCTVTLNDPPQAKRICKVLLIS